MITINEVKQVNANQETGKVFFHMMNGKTIVRTIDKSEIRIAKTVTRRNGAVAGMEEYIRLFNEKYSEPQNIKNVELSASEKRFFELQNMSKVMSLDGEQEEELKQLENE